jgi:hypothetical protein
MARLSRFLRGWTAYFMPLSVAPAAGDKHQAALRASPARLPGPGNRARQARAGCQSLLWAKNPVIAGVTTRKDPKSAAWHGIMPGIRLAGPGRRHARASCAREADWHRVYPS